MDFDQDKCTLNEVKSDKDFEKFLLSNKRHFKDEKAFITWLRSGLRKGLWEKHPVKVEYKQTRKIKIKNPSPNPRKGYEEVWGYQCECCGDHFLDKEIEVDHIIGENSLKSLDDFISFFRSLVFVTSDSMQLLCKECHATKTYSERYGKTPLESEAIRKAINTNNSPFKNGECFGVTFIVNKNLSFSCEVEPEDFEFEFNVLDLKGVEEKYLKRFKVNFFRVNPTWKTVTHKYFEYDFDRSTGLFSGRIICNESELKRLGVNKKLSKEKAKELLADLYLRELKSVKEV